MSEVYGFIAKGGPVMIPIILGSVIALAIFLERIWALRRSVIIPDGFIDKITILLRAGKRHEAVTLCESAGVPAARVVIPMIKQRGLSEQEIEKAVEDAGRRETNQMNRYIEALGTIASIEPLLGLLGTVTGLIRAFQQVVYYSGEGAIDPGRLASGIWEALITTAGGLIVAIPAYIGYRYLVARVDSFTVRLEEGATAVLNLVKYHRGELASAEEKAKAAAAAGEEE